MIKYKTKKILTISIFFLTIIILIIQFSGLKDFDLNHAKVEDITFYSKNNALHGSLVLPKY